MQSGAANAAENMFREILSAARFPDVTSEYNSGKLLDIARQYRSDAMAKVESDFAKQGRLLNWNYSSPGFIIDCLFSLDSVIAPCGSSNPERFGFDVTLNPAEVYKKVKKLRKPQHIYQHLGVTRCAVILLIPSPNWNNVWGWGLLNNMQKEALVERVVDLIYEMAESNLAVSEHTVYF